MKRIERETGLENLVERLVQLNLTDLQSLLLEVYRGQSQKKQPADILKDYLQNRFVRPAKLSSHSLAELNSLFLGQLPEAFSVLELSPVCPLGTNSVVAGIDQNWALSTSRNTEVISDATNVLSLECAARRKDLLRLRSKSLESVKLAANHRFLRPQVYANLDFLAHFQMLSLVTAGRDEGNLRFELAAIIEHIGFYLRSVQAFLGQSYQLEVHLTDFHSADRTIWLEPAFLTPIQKAFPEVVCPLKPERESGREYYRDLCFHIYMMSPSGKSYQIADGGSVNWTAQLLSNAKERLVISGLSSERLCLEKQGLGD